MNEYTYLVTIPFGKLETSEAMMKKIKDIGYSSHLIKITDKEYSKIKEWCEVHPE